MLEKSLILSKKLGDLLINKKLSLAVAESCTGGLVSSLITDVGGSSNYFVLGVVTYSNDQKIKVLNVSPNTLKKFGSVSKDVCCQMIKGIKNISGANIAVAITGYAGPLSEKGIIKGTVFIGVYFKKKISIKKFLFRGDRLTIKSKAVKNALGRIISIVKDNT